MHRFGLVVSLVSVLASSAGCAVATYNVAAVSQQEIAEADGYCHRKLQPVGPSDLITRTPNDGDFIDYYGPCNGPSLADQIEKQRRFESFRFGREYMDEG
jgi:hypothetical protein